MRNIKLEIEYEGTNYCGWQIQNHPKSKVTKSQGQSEAKRSLPEGDKATSIQETIEKALESITQEPVKLTASGRTDAGVHARGQVANFKTKSTIPIRKLQKALNGTLPKDISITDAKEADPCFNSRFDAKTKLYRYTILNNSYPSPFARNTTIFCPYKLNLKLMRRESRVLIGKHNFKSFQASGKKDKNPVKIIKKISITKKGNFIYIDIEANGFLYNMARNIAGTLLEIGRGKIKKGSIERILLSKNRQAAGSCAPAKGLCLIKVKY